jgi:serine protease Do
VLAAQAIKVHADSGSFLGVGVAEIDAERAKRMKLEEERGVEITRVQEDSPAAETGLKKGDVVLKYNNQRVEGTEQFVRLVRETPVGRTVELVISRDGAAQTLAVTIGRRKSRPFPFAPEILKEGENLLLRFGRPDIPKPYMSWRSSQLGVLVESIDGQLAGYFGVKQGVLVRSVLKDSAAEKAGIKAGDLILEVDGEKVDTPREVSRAVRSARSKETFPVTMMRNRKEMSLSVTIEQDSSEGKSRGQ